MAEDPNAPTLQLAVFSLCLSLGTSYLLPRTKPSPTPRPKLPHFPKELQSQGHKLQSDLRIPNEKFCKDMQLQPYRQYMILPWWYVHCERLLEREEKQMRGSKYPLLPIYSKILNLVQKYKQKQALIRAVQNF